MCIRRITALTLLLALVLTQLGIPARATAASGA